MADTGNADSATASDATSDLPSSDPSDTQTADNKILVVYFSWSGHLDSMAHWVADETGGDLYRMTAKDPYPDDYNQTADRAKQEQDNDERPEIMIDLTEEQMVQYDTVFFGFLVWWYDLPMSMWTFLESYDFSGKTIIPFFSHEGSSNGAGALPTIEKLAEGATVRSDDVLSIRGGSVADSEEDVREWVQGLGYQKTAQTPQEELPAPSGKTLVVYYSASGNTGRVAEYVADELGVDTFEIIPVNVYSDEDINWNNIPAPTEIDFGDEYIRGFLFDNVLHSENDGDIHFGLYIPENYDGSEPYAVCYITGLRRAVLSGRRSQYPRRGLRDRSAEIQRENDHHRAAAKRLERDLSQADDCTYPVFFGALQH